MPLAPSSRLSGYVREVSNTNGGTSAIAHIAEPVANRGEKLTISGDCNMRLVEPLWGVLEITEGLTCLIFACIKHAHPKVIVHGAFGGMAGSSVGAGCPAQ